MAAAWPARWTFPRPKVTVVLDKATRTRELVEASGHLPRTPPCPRPHSPKPWATESAHTHPDKLQRHHVSCSMRPT